MTPNDVVEFSGAELGISICSFREIFTIEYYEATNFLGQDFWKQIIEAKADYSAEPEYEPGSYNAGEVVKYKSVYYQATTTTTAQPPKTPDWEVATRFEGECATAYEHLFCFFWAPYVAKKILQKKLPFIRTKISSAGVLSYNGADFKTSSQTDYTRLHSAVNADAKMALNNLRHFLKQEEQMTNPCFEKFVEFEKDECDANGKKPLQRINTYKFG